MSSDNQGAPRQRGDMILKMTVWAWYCDAPQGGWLFHGNPNRGLPPFHFGTIENVLHGEHLIWEHTRKALEMDIRIVEWNERFQGHRVKPKLITLELRHANPATRSRRNKKENKGGSK